MSAQLGALNGQKLQTKGIATSETRADARSVATSSLYDKENSIASDGQEIAATFDTAINGTKRAPKKQAALIEKSTGHSLQNNDAENELPTLDSVPEDSHEKKKGNSKVLKKLKPDQISGEDNNVDIDKKLQDIASLMRFWPQSAQKPKVGAQEKASNPIETQFEIIENMLSSVKEKFEFYKTKITGVPVSSSLVQSTFQVLDNFVSLLVLIKNEPKTLEKLSQFSEIVRQIISNFETQTDLHFAAKQPETNCLKTPSPQTLSQITDFESIDAKHSALGASTNFDLTYNQEKLSRNNNGQQTSTITISSQVFENAARIASPLRTSDEKASTDKASAFNIANRIDVSASSSTGDDAQSQQGGQNSREQERQSQDEKKIPEFLLNDDQKKTKIS